MSQDSSPSSKRGKKYAVKFTGDEYTLPDFYGEDRLVILARDPNWIFAYWEVTEWKKEQIKREYGSDIFEKTQAVLRVHDVTGVERFNGSNSVGYKDNPANLEVRNWYVRVDGSGRTYCIELGLKTQDGRFILLLRSNIITLPSGLVSELTDEQWMLLQEDYDKLLRLSGVDRIGVGSLEMAKYLAKRWEMLNVISSGAFSGVSSRGFRGPGGVRKFWLVADAELIVYGATEPTATLTINGKAVKLNPDGTFSIRVDFPDGDKVFDIKAVSEDKVEERKIKITAERKTK